MFMNKPSNQRVTRFVVFSFDDGLIDFKNNALPILDLYGFKASVNIISGFSDKSIVPHYRCLTIDDIKLLYLSGHEIANHTNSHKKHGSYEELDICNNKINNWCNHDKIVGIVMPKYAKPSKSSYKFIKKKKPPYFTYEPRHFFSFLTIFLY